MIVARDGEDRRARRIGFDVVRHDRNRAVLPSGLVQVSVTLNNIAPVKSAGDVIVNEAGSPVCTVQVPSLRSVPLLTVHPDGTSAIVIVTTAPSFADVPASPRLIGSPATPAGALLNAVLLVLIVGGFAKVKSLTVWVEAFSPVAAEKPT